MNTECNEMQRMASGEDWSARTSRLCLFILKSLYIYLGF